MARARFIGVNHIALEVGDIDEALDFYGAVFDFELRGRVGDRMAFLDAGDQFIALAAGRRQPPDDERHFGLVVDDSDAVRTALAANGVEIAQIVRGERQPLSRQERDEVLKHRWSYLEDDLVVAAWNAAFIYDTEAGALALIEIFEFANSQLLEFRYHDELLEGETTTLYARLEERHWLDMLRGRRHTNEALRIQSLYLDVNELTDRMENAVKFVGDPYAARLFGLAAARLGLERWKKNVEEKLDTLNDIHRFAVERTGISQANILELVIVGILLIELFRIVP